MVLLMKVGRQTVLGRQMVVARQKVVMWNSYRPLARSQQCLQAHLQSCLPQARQADAAVQQSFPNVDGS